MRIPFHRLPEILANMSRADPQEGASSREPRSASHGPVPLPNKTDGHASLPRRDLAELKRLQKRVIDTSLQAAQVMDADPSRTAAEKRQALLPSYEARLALARKKDSIGNRDTLTPEQAHIVHARLVQAGALLLETPCDPPATEPQARALAALVNAALWYHATVYLAGIPPQNMPPLAVEGAREDTNGAAFSAVKLKWPLITAGTEFVATTPTALMEGAFALRHEGSHMQQLNRSPRIGGWNASIFRTSCHPQAGSLKVDRQLSPLSKRTIDRFRGALLSARPRETGAKLDESTVANLVAPYGKHLNRVGGLRPVGGVEKLVPLLAEAMQDVLQPGDAFAPLQKKIAEGRAIPSPVVDDPEAARLAMYVVHHEGLLNEAMHSQVWSADNTRKLQVCMDALVRDVPALNGRDKLARIANALDEVVRQLEAEHGRDLHIPASLPRQARLRHDAFVAVKNDALGTLDRNLQQLVPGWRRESATCIQEAEASSLFNQKVAGIQNAFRANPRLQARSAQAEVVDAVMALAAWFIGWPSLDGKPMPDIDIFQPGMNSERQREHAARLPGTFPRVPGMNASLPPIDAGWHRPSADAAADSHQKPTSRFRSDLWRLKVPARYFEPGEIDKLPSRLAGLAARFAWIVVSTIANRTDNGRLSAAAVQAAGLEGAALSDTVTMQLRALDADPTDADWFAPAQARSSLPSLVGPSAPVGSGASTPIPVFASSAAHAFFTTHRGLAQPRWPLPPSAKAPPEDIRQFLEAHPESAAHILWTLVNHTPQFTSDELTDECLRALVKAEAQDEGNPHRDRARQAYEAISITHMNRTYWQFCRAVKAAS